MEKFTETIGVKVSIDLVDRITAAASYYGEGRCEYIRRLIEADLNQLHQKHRLLTSIFGQDGKEPKRHGV
jgi:predicted DNA-binding protein